jgi:hypothetical protein
VVYVAEHVTGDGLGLTAGDAPGDADGLAPGDAEGLAPGDGVAVAPGDGVGKGSAISIVGLGNGDGRTDGKGLGDGLAVLFALMVEPLSAGLRFVFALTFGTSSR